MTRARFHEGAAQLSRTLRLLRMGVGWPLIRWKKFRLSESWSNMLRLLSLRLLPGRRAEESWCSGARLVVAGRPALGRVSGAKRWAWPRFPSCLLRLAGAHLQGRAVGAGGRRLPDTRASPAPTAARQGPLRNAVISMSYAYPQGMRGQAPPVTPLTDGRLASPVTTTAASGGGSAPHGSGRCGGPRPGTRTACRPRTATRRWRGGWPLERWK